jgi:hypothetical protein
MSVLLHAFACTPHAPGSFPFDSVLGTQLAMNVAAVWSGYGNTPSQGLDGPHSSARHLPFARSTRFESRAIRDPKQARASHSTIPPRYTFFYSFNSIPSISRTECPVVFVSTTKYAPALSPPRVAEVADQDRSASSLAVEGKFIPLELPATLLQLGNILAVGVL